MFQKYKIGFLSILLTGITVPLISFAQSYNFKNYSAEQGLPFVQVYSIFQDSKGNLWSGGYGGLSRFDGKAFTNYSPKNGLANHWVTSIAEDKNGDIWAGTISGISKLEGKSFITFTKKHGLVGDYVNALTTDRYGNLWIATTTGITIYDGKIFTSLTSKNGLPTNNISLIYADKSGTIWMNSDSGVTKIVFDQGTSQDKSFSNYKIINGAYKHQVTSITEDNTGVIWFGTGNGVVKYDGVENKVFTTNDGLFDNDILSVEKDKQSNSVWVGTLKGLNKISENGRIESYRVSNMQSGNKVEKLFVDEEENLWLGTQNGLYRFRDPSFSTYAEKEGLNAPFVFPVFRDSKKQLWAGTYDGGFYRYDKNKFKYFSEKDGLIGTQMYAGTEDAQGNIWMGTNKGLSIYNGNTFKNYKGFEEGLKSDSVTSILLDSKGQMWLGGNRGGAVWNGKKFKTFELKSDGENFDVWYLFEDSKKNIWMGTYLGGLYMFDGKNYYNYSQKLNLKSKSYFSVTEDKAGNLYFGSFDGVYIYNPSAEKILHVSEKDGLSSDLVYVMAFDTGCHYLYIGTNQGVNKFDAKKFLQNGEINIQHYGQEEGLTSLETNSNGIWRDEDGTFWFGTVNGLIHFDPNAMNQNSAEAIINITSTRIFYNDTALPVNSTLPYYLNNISFEYIGICLTNPGKVRYKYMLAGYDKNWSPETKETFARYSNLLPGRYNFKVISCNNEGLWNKEPATFSFSISPPFWRTWWFRLSVIAAIITFIAAFLRARTASIRKKEAEKLSREIQLANNELKALRAQMDPHFIFNSLSSIQSFIMTKDEDSALLYLNKFAKLIRTILSNSEKPTVTIHEEIDALKLYLELESLRWANKFEFIIHIANEIETDFHRIPSMLIQPYVENAILHGLVPKEDGKGKVEISVTQNDTHIICSIIDNGIGRKKSNEQKQRSGKPGHESMGMRITSDRLEVLNRMHNSELSVIINDLYDSSGNSCGTSVEIFIPVS